MASPRLILRRAVFLRRLLEPRGSLTNTHSLTLLEGTLPCRPQGGTGWHCSQQLVGLLRVLHIWCCRSLVACTAPQYPLAAILSWAQRSSSAAAASYIRVSGSILSSLRDFLFSVSTFYLLIWLPLRKFIAYSFTDRSVVAKPVKKVWSAHVILRGKTSETGRCQNAKKRDRYLRLGVEANLAETVVLLGEVDDTGWLVHAAIDVPNVEVLGRVHHKELAKAVHETLCASHRRTLVSSIVVDSTPLYSNNWQLACIAPKSDRSGVGVVVDPAHTNEGGIKASHTSQAYLRY